MTLSGLIIFMTGTLAIIGWITGKHVLSSIHTDYIPMAPATALIFIVFGVLMFFKLIGNRNKRIKPYILTIISIITLAGLLHFLGFFIHRELTLEQFLISGKEKLGHIPINKMSHYGGLLFFISGIAVLLKYFGRDHKIIVNLIGNLGLFVSFAGFVASLGYIFGTPFLYSGNFIPLAFTSAISFIFLGLGLLTLSGENNYFVRKLIGPQASARILRTFLPFLILENVLGDALEQHISRYYNINEAMISAIVSLTSIIIAIILTLYLTKLIFKSADKAELERIKAERALKESLEVRDLLLKTIPFGMDIIDKNGTILFLNEIMKKNIGKDTVGTKCWEVYRDDKTQCTDCPLIDNLKVGDTKTIESHNVLGGKIFEINHTGLMFNGVEAVLEIFHDITLRKQSELKLKEYAGELELANSTKNKLFSIIAHDLRSPFNSILGLTNLLNDQYENFNDEDKKLALLKLKESSENAFNLLDNLLAWSLTQREGIKVTPERIDLFDITDLQTDIFGAIAQTKDIRIINLVIPDTFANADGNMVTTIVRNLINNALKFTYSGGNITLSSFEKDDKVGVSISDSGVGIDPEILIRLFNSADTQTTRGTANEKGTGLGLLICKEFVEINGGKIWVESKKGMGSRFSFTLPKCLEPEKINSQRN